MPLDEVVKLRRLLAVDLGRYIPVGDMQVRGTEVLKSWIFFLGQHFHAVMLLLTELRCTGWSVQEIRWGQKARHIKKISTPSTTL